nr:iron-sulfur cluster-binding domain-containing protein [Aquimarina sp. U1-2]
MYAARTPEETIFKGAIDRLQKNHADYLTVDYYFSEIKNSSRIDKKDIEDVLRGKDLQNTLVYVCAPEGIVTMVWSVLQSVNLNPEHFKYESFTTSALNIHKVNIPSKDATVYFQDESKNYEIQVKKDNTLLDELIDKNVPIDYSCKSGDCEMCSCKIKQGEIVSLDGKNLKKYKTGDVILPCVSYAASEKIELAKA